MLYVEKLTGNILTRAEIKRMNPALSLPKILPQDFMDELEVTELADDLVYPEVVNGQTIEPTGKAVQLEDKWVREFIATGTPVDTPIDDRVDKRDIDEIVLDGEGMQAMRKAIAALYAGATEPPAEYVTYLEKIEALEDSK